jgi:hypothetical protein
MKQDKTMAKAQDPCIIWSTDPNEKREALCTIDRDEFYEMYVRAAENFYHAKSAGSRILSLEINHTSGLGNVPAWREISVGQTASFLERLKEKGVAPAVRELARENLDLESSLVRFNAMAKEFVEMAKTIALAHEIASSAHASQTFARPQDCEGLFHIPYMQHPRNIATRAMELSLTSNSVVVALLHDVVEDTDIKLDSLRQRFGNQVADGVSKLTKNPSQSRAEFLAYVKDLRGEIAIIKALDRVDNLIRGFGNYDAKYRQRVLEECELVYDGFFQREPKLMPLVSMYELIKNELTRFSQ